MIWPAALWSALGVLGIPVARRLEHLFSGWVAPAVANLKAAAPWLHGLVPPFAALFSGAVPAPLLGLYGRLDWLQWLLGGLITVGLLGAVGAVLKRASTAAPEVDLEGAVLAEPRWALYRATGQLWLGSLWLGTLVGLGLAAAEWGWSEEVWRGDRRRDPLVCLGLARLTWSNLIFALTANFWMVLAFQIVWLQLWVARSAGEAT